MNLVMLQLLIPHQRSIFVAELVTGLDLLAQFVQLHELVQRAAHRHVLGEVVKEILHCFHARS